MHPPESDEDNEEAKKKEVQTPKTPKTPATPGATSMNSCEYAKNISAAIPVNDKDAEALMKQLAAKLGHKVKPKHHKSKKDKDKKKDKKHATERKASGSTGKE